MMNQSNTTHAQDKLPKAERVVSDLVQTARTAQQVYARYSQEQVDEVVTAVGWALIDPDNNRTLAEQAVADTDLGNVADKLTKNHRKTLGLLRDMKGQRTVGVINDDPARGLVEIARPVGVVGAVVPSTNPVATPFNKTLNALKGGNAIILAPSPKGQNVCERVVELMREALYRVGAPGDLVQKLPEPVSKDTTYELMRQVDLVVVTGSQNNVRAAYSSGTPAIGVGAGNVPSIIDSSAELEAAAEKIAASKSFDNATSCSSENSVIILDEIYEEAVTALEGAGGRLLTADQKASLQQAMWPSGKLSSAVTAKSVERIVEAAGLTVPDAANARFLMVEEYGYGPDFPYSDEKLSPVLTVYRVSDFDEAMKLAANVLEWKGKGHSVSIHTRDDDHVMRLGLELPVCRVIVNQAHTFATGGNFDNAMPFSLSMGCGSWGGNSISDNLNFRHFINTTRIVRTTTRNEPSLDDIFGDYWRNHGITPDGH
jgi:sulfoacetaldehyde dehydrogenase